MSGKKVLFFAEAVTLAHVGRMLALSGLLHEAETELACSDAYAALVDRADVRRRSIRSIAPATFLARLQAGRPAYTQAELEAYVRDDLRLIADVRPDVIVGDFRLSLSVSARVAGVPYVNVTNAYWSPHANPVFRAPSLSFARAIPPAITDPIFRIARPFAFALHALPMNRVRRAYGLTALPLDVRNVYCDGDLTLYADLPQLVPVEAAPRTHRYIGPVLWSPVHEPPAWWREVIDGEPPIYVSLGSSGTASALPAVIDALRPLQSPIVVATAGRAGALARRERVWVTDFVAGNLICAKACAVVCNGGSPATLQALVHGVPVVGIATNLDQYLNMGYIERYGAGILLRSDRARAASVREATRRAVHDAGMRNRARAIAELAGQTRAETEFPGALGSLLDRALRPKA
jgi:UDP:flavonoid glycosyltransferase YjiC (YdhE family)